MIILNKDANLAVSIFNKNNCLYIKNYTNKIEGISNNVYLYSALIDNYNDIHICFIDLKNYFYYYTYTNNSLNLISSFKLNVSSKKVSKLSMHLLNDSINVFFSKSINKHYHNIYHLNYSFYNNELIEFDIKNAFKSRLPLYTINVSNNHIICSYYVKSKNKIDLESMVYNDNKKDWSHFSNIKTSNILFKYCDTIKY
ncbi:hypothetical protein VN21_00065 [Paraclostridium benzoelyticum]|uniref:Uncharacterized protein n=1 Tax=Paraclostridium benzoelyticum TaxID=1629550 RepID=A0A0M3DKC7_9FIRM|nr:hypothetical protein [Paraclostridium benzoelyticum]KKY03025.1 hypothetical protein VN21_00065 [Paraclostridium benzoelyticum]